MATGLFNLKQVNQAISQGAWSGYIAPKWVEYLVVAGGGAGAINRGAGGGGGGGLLTGIVTVAAGTSYTVTVGAGGTGGTGAVTSGASSLFGAISTSGGGAGGSSNQASLGGSSGGSGGGGAGSAGSGGAGGQSTANQGNTGGTSSGGATTSNSEGGAGGGGAGTVGLNATVATYGGNGGAGIASSISGTVVTYAGGGGGAANGTSGSYAGAGGVGGGGAGRAVLDGNGNATSGGSNTGGGGGGHPNQTITGSSGSGGSGIVVVRYPGNVQFYTGGTVTYSNGYIVHNFTANGTLAPTTPTVVSEYQISRSLRFNSADSAYLNRTPASAGNRRTWTWSAWIKRSALGVTQQIFSSRPTSSPYALIYFASETLNYAETGLTLTTTQVFRDVSAWYHIVIATDTTQATASDRLKFYVNGVQVTSFSTATYPSQNYETQINTATQHNLSGAQPYGAEYYSGYMTEVNFIDGQALPPTSFGYVNPTTGIWSPAKFVGGYGTNGFYLNFSDNSNTTAATLGKDYSGNGNNWTPNNFSVTAGAGNDSLVDSPTSYGTDTGVGGTVRGNYATLNPLVVFGTSAFSNGNLDVSVSSLNTNNFATIAIPTSGKWYWEYQITSVGGGAFPMAGIIATGSSALTSNVVYRTNGDKNIDGTGSAYGATYTTTDIIGVAVDTDGGTVTFYKNGSSQGAITYATSSGNYSPALRSNAATDNFTFNFGQRAFANTAPSGFKALCTQNLPTPTIGATTATLANKYFDATLYTGTGSTLAVTNAGGFQPDWVWLKNRSNTAYHSIWDAVRGRSAGGLASNDTGAEQASTAGNDFVSFNSNGFSVGPAQNWNVDTNGNTYVAWNWKANGTGVTNTAGSITSTVSANTTSGFSVVTYTNASSGTVGHGLGVAPAMVIYKDRTNVTNWIVLHQSLANMSSSFLVLNLTNAVATLGTALGGNPTSSVIYTNTDIIQNGAASVAYCFAAVAGYSAFGSFVGNGSADGAFVYTGFRPAFVMLKASSTGGAGYNWGMFDNDRLGYNSAQRDLRANLSDAEGTDNNLIDFLSNGFKIRSTSNGFGGGSGVTYIYMAFAENPFKTSLAR